MAVMNAFSGSDAAYHTWYVLNCGGYEVTLDEALWPQKQRFASYRLFGEQGESSDIVGRELDA